MHTPADWIRALYVEAPSDFIKITHNPERSVKTSGNNQVHVPILSSSFVHDLKEGRHYGYIKNFTKLGKLTQMLASLHHSGSVIVEPCDVPISKRHLDMVYAHMRFTDKPHLGAIAETSRAQYSFDMAEIPHGKEVMDSKCVIMGNVNTNSHLLLDNVMTPAIRVYCGRGQGIIVLPFVLSGAMGPVSTAAPITQAMAEAIMCCAYARLDQRRRAFCFGNLFVVNVIEVRRSHLWNARALDV